MRGSIMTSLIIEPTATAQWQSLVKEAWDITGEKADEEMEHYLVLLLMRFSDNSTVGTRALGLEYLESQEREGEASKPYCVMSEINASSFLASFLVEPSGFASTWAIMLSLGKGLIIFYRH